MAILSNDDLKRLQKIEIEMAKAFVDFCQKHKLLCYLCGGGCIGAVRNGGMIPWDDDLDFFMPREDYEKFYDLWIKETGNTGKYVLEAANKDHVDGNLFVSLRDTTTTYIKPYQREMDITHGAVLDILPLDGYPNSKIERKKQVFWCLIYSLYCSQVIPTKHGRLLALGSKILLELVPSKKMRYKFWSKAKKEMTKYRISDCDGVTELCSGPMYMRNWLPKSAFKEALFVPFEDTKMPIPVGYDAYLRIVFGDYMQLPPKEKRVASHDASFIDLNKSFKEYRGIEYLTDSIRKQ